MYSKVCLSAVLWIVVVQLGGCETVSNPTAYTLYSPENLSAEQATTAEDFQSIEAGLLEKYRKRPDIAAANLAFLYVDAGLTGQAIPYLQEMSSSAIGQYEVKLKNTPRLNTALNFLGEAYMDLSRFSDAESLFRRTLPALESFEKQKRTEKISLAVNLLSLAVQAAKGADQEQLDKFAKKATEGSEDWVLQYAIDKYRSLTNLAELYLRTGRLTEATELYKRLLARPDLTRRAIVHAGLGALYLQTQQTEAAGEQMDLALAELSATGTVNGYSIADQALVQTRAAKYRALTVDYAGAEVLLSAAETLVVEAYDNRHPTLATVYAERANLKVLQSDLPAAITLLNAAIKIESRKSSSHLELANLHKEIARLYSNTGDSSAALTNLRIGFDIEEGVLSRDLLVGSDVQKRQLLGRLGDSVDVAINFHLRNPDNPQAARLAMDTVLSRKGRSVDAMSGNLRDSYAVGDSYTRELFSNLARIRAEIVRRAYQSPYALKDPPTPSQLSSREAKDNAKLVKEAELIQDLIARSAGYNAEATQRLDIDTVSGELAKNDVLVEYVKYRPDNLPDQEQYIVYVLDASGALQWRVLGSGKQIERAITVFLEDIENVSGNVAESGRQLDALLFESVRQMSGIADRYYISPDSQINLVPFDALFTIDARQVVSLLEISYLNSGRELLKRKRPEQQRATISSVSPVIFADPDYDSTAVAVRDEAGAGSRDLSELGQWCCTRLPGTQAEAREIARFFPAATIYSGADANKSELLQVESPDVLHIATHGYFLRDSDGKIPIDSGQSFLQNPLLRSGLAMSGFNPVEGGYDGALTALEASGLNLAGTKLVVLSACKTGVGDIQNGEGVLGLRRSFRIAGAETLVMSLWDVPDRETKDLMAYFYENLSKNVARSAALRQAKLRLMNNPKTRHPWFWGAFILSGERTSLAGNHSVSNTR